MKDELIPLITGKNSGKKWTFNKASRTALLIVSFFVAGYAFFVSLSSREGASFSEFLAAVGANGEYFFFALMLFFAAVLSETARFVVLIFATKKTFRPLLAFRTAMIGRFYSAVTPFVNGGQGVQTQVLGEAKMSKAVSFSIPFAQVFLKTLTWNLLILFFFITNSAAAAGIKWWALAGLVLNGVFPVLFFVFSVNEKLAKRIITLALKFGLKVKLIKNYEASLSTAWSFLEDLSISVRSIVRNLFTFLVLLILYAAEFFAVMSIPYFLFMSAGESVEYGFMLVSYMFIYLSASAVPIPGAAGAYELLFLTAYSGAAKGNMTYWLMFTMRFFTYFYYIAAGYAVQLCDYIAKRVRRKMELQRLIAEHAAAEANEESGKEKERKIETEK
ncbi:MAG: flippase-like domain-containing protein [Clostridiales bacterium]|jgi:uncharacterized protein (TIRG00374 family)|nr:flippase-like domain-containing protein [Clostridiales bacterium]